MKNEEIETQILARWLDYHNYKYSHIANEIWIWWYVWMRVWSKKKKMGVKKWLPDFLIILKRWSLLFIELKAENIKYKRVPKEQKERINEFNRIANIQAWVCFWAEQAIDYIIFNEKK